MATVNNGGSVELWDTRDPARPRRAAELAIDTRYTFPLAFAPVSPGGPTSGANILATGADDFSIRLWNTDTRTSRHRWDHDSSVRPTSSAVSPSVPTAAVWR